MGHLSPPQGSSRRNRRWFRAAVAGVAAVAMTGPLVAGAAAQAAETPLWKTEIAQIPSTAYSRDALTYLTEATEALRPWVDEHQLAEARLEPVLADVGTAYFDGARFEGRTQADAAFDNLRPFEQFLKSRMTGASPPNGDAEVGHVTALVSSMTAVRLLADATIQDGHAVVDPFGSPDLPADIELPEGLATARAHLADAEANLAKTDEFFRKANVEPATINAQRTWSSGFAVLETFGITYDGDHDADGVVDVVELMMGASPLLADSDFDGLTDQFEITKLAGWTWPANPDSDEDGVGDGQEDLDGDGLTNLQEQDLGTSPTNPDTDGDGASDGAEVAAGTNPLVFDLPVQPPVPPDPGLPPVVTQPTDVDTDGDGIIDERETAEVGTDPNDADSDGDGLGDGAELDVEVTDPSSSDSDGDGMTDSYEIQHQLDQGINPMVFDKRMSSWDYVNDFVAGLVLGEFDVRESTAWLAGQLCSAALSFIPVVGWIVGGVADIRDGIAGAINSDWVGVGFSVAGLIPYVGDLGSIGAKVVKFVQRFPTSKLDAVRLVVHSSWLADGVQTAILKLVHPLAYGRLADAGGLSDTMILRIARADRTDLGRLADAYSEPLRRTWTAQTPPLYSGAQGQDWVAGELARLGRTVTNNVNPAVSTVTPLGRRFPDVVEDLPGGGQAWHEVKTGMPVRGNPVEQCRKDGAHLRDAGNDVTALMWHFAPWTDRSGNLALGIDDALLACLKEEGINFIIYPPAP